MYLLFPVLLDFNKKRNLALLTTSLLCDCTAFVLQKTKHG